MGSIIFFVLRALSPFDVQGVLQETRAVLSISAAARTDAGVHARGQVRVLKGKRLTAAGLDLSWPQVLCQP